MLCARKGEEVPGQTMSRATVANLVGGVHVKNTLGGGPPWPPFPTSLIEAVSKCGNRYIACSVSYLLPVGAIGASSHLPIFPAAHSMTQSVLRQSSAKPEIDFNGNSLSTHTHCVKIDKNMVHSGLPCINFVFEIMIPKKGSKPKIFMKQTIYRLIQVHAPTLSFFGTFSTFSLIFLDFSFMISWDSISQKPMKPAFACKVYLCKAKSCLLVS